MTAMGQREYLRAIYDRYRRSSAEVKGKILDEFCRVCDCHRKHAIRLLNGPRPEAHPRPRRPRGPSYGRAVIQALVVLWEAAGYPWSVRLKAMLPLWLPWLRTRLTLTPKLERQLQAISPRQIDRRLQSRKRVLPRRADPVHPRPALQERRQRPHRAEELDPRAQADRLGPLRQSRRRGSAQRPLPPRTTADDESVPAFGEAAAQGARRLPAQTHLRPPADSARPAAGLPRRRSGEGERAAPTACHHRSVRAGDHHREEDRPHRGPGSPSGPLGPGNNSNGVTMSPRVTSTNGLTGSARPLGPLASRHDSRPLQ